MNRITLSCLGMALALSGCAVGPDYHRPDGAIPAVFKEYAGWQPASPAEMASHDAWWEIYEDAELNTWVAQVAISNQNVVAAAAQYRQAQALLGVAQSARFPTLGLNGVASRTQGPESTGRVSGANASNASAGDGVTNTVRATLNVAWEVDLWGRMGRSVEANQAAAEASQSDLQSALLSAQATLVQTWFQWRVTVEQKSLLDRTEVAYERSLAITRNKYNAGVVTRADVVQAEVQLRAVQAQRLEIDVQRAQFEHAMAVLLGQPPAAWTPGPQTRLPVLPGVPQQIPSSLLERRPDIAGAERRMASANAQIGIAQAAWFPSLTFSAMGGYQNNSFSQLLTAPHRTWSVGPALALSLFDGGTRTAQQDGAIAAYDKAVASYRQTVLVAFQEVEDNLATLRLLAQEAGVQQEATQAAEEALQIVENQYRAGTVSYLNVLAVQTTALTAQRNDISIAGRRLVAHAALLKALGGPGASGRVRERAEAGAM